MSEDDLYKTLRVDKKASKESIKKNFRRLAKRLHPDQGGDEQEFIKVKEAYRILIDDDLRAYYDETGAIKQESNELQIEKTAMATFSNLFVKLVEEDQNGDLDYLNSIRLTMNHSIPNLKVEIEKLKNKIKRWEKINKRLSFKGEGEDFLTNVIKSHIAIIHKGIAAKEFDLKVIGKILFLVDYYEVAPPEELYHKITAGPTVSYNTFYWR